MNRIIKALILAGVFTGLTACSAISEFTSSTSSTLDAATPDITLNNFIDNRLASIKQDAAVGGGENIDALAELMGKQDNKAFAEFMRTNYDRLFSDLENSTELVARIEQFSSDTKG